MCGDVTVLPVELVTLCISTSAWTLVLIIYLNQFITAEPLHASLELQMEPPLVNVSFPKKEKTQYTRLVKLNIFLRVRSTSRTCKSELIIVFLFAWGSIKVDKKRRRRRSCFSINAGADAIDWSILTGVFSCGAFQYVDASICSSLWSRH